MKKMYFIFTMVAFVSIAMAQSNIGTVNQIGDDNKAEIFQEGHENTVTINQWGSNIAFIEQIGEKNKAIGFTSSTVSNIFNFYGFSMPGYEDYSQVQLGSNYARIYINGNNNITARYQTGYWSSLVSNNNASLTIRGDFNEAAQVQFSNQSYSNIDIYGNSNNTGSLQTAYYNEANNDNSEIFVNGNSNDVSSKQIGHENYAMIIVIGNSNEGYIQHGLVFDDWQDCNSNYGFISQEGDFNHASILSFASYNKGVIFQTGENNIGSIDQLGNYNDAEIMQSGNNNFALVNQTIN